MGPVLAAERALFLLFALRILPLNLRHAPEGAVRCRLNRAGFAGGVSSLLQLEQVGWNVRNCPKRSSAGGAANGDNWVDSGRAFSVRKGTL